MPYDALLFDLDGTLIYTNPECIYWMVRKTLSEFGKEISDEEIDRFWFDHKREKFIKEKFGIDAKDFWNTYNKYDTADFRREHAKAYEDTTFLKELKENGYRTGIVTGAPVHMISIGWDILGKENIGMIVRSQLSSGIRPKPDPHGIEECLKALGAERSRAVYVGNGEEDIKTAKNAGVLDMLYM